MNPVGKALWYMEAHFAADIDLEAIARAGNISRFHLSRAFGVATGYSVMRYLRGRRLSEAARRLSHGAPDILAVALEAGYGSHEAFTRAFRDQFGTTPESVRAQGHIDNLFIVEPIKMDESFVADLAAPRYVDTQPMVIAGLSERYLCETSAGIPAQWQRFLPHLGHIPTQRGNVAYGVRYNSDDEGYFDYLCGVEVEDVSRLPQGWSHVRIPAQTYAVFPHHGHISDIRRTHNTIWNKWLPESGREHAEAPDFERYGEDFNSMTGMGTVEIWVPVKS